MIRSRVKLLIRVACFLGLLVCSPAFAQEWADKMFDHAEHDFGILAKGAKVEHRFTITNVFKENLEIASIHSSCGCTDPTSGR